MWNKGWWCGVKWVVCFVSDPDINAILQQARLGSWLVRCDVSVEVWWLGVWDKEWWCGAMGVVCCVSDPDAIAILNQASMTWKCGNFVVPCVG